MALIYVVEDDPSIQEIERMVLKNSNYMVQMFDRASTFFEKIEDILPDLILLDIMLPDEDGYEIVRKLRNDARTRKIPVIMITAKTSEMDMVRGLDMGADDYIRKPFSVMELLSRVKALLRRVVEEEPSQLSVGDILLDHERHTVTAGDATISLTLKEYELLRYLMTNEGIV
ncbi:MAG: response regulator transcription factor, partial [Lachnospiraceae bacterium]|nr:response regulator transcription factor [Lachnospiraceae bacterium]